MAFISAYSFIYFFIGCTIQVHKATLRVYKENFESGEFTGNEEELKQIIERLVEDGSIIEARARMVKK